MMVNGNPEQLEIKKTFPGDEDVFVLVAAKKNAVQIGVAGGSFEGGKPVTVKLGKKLTLVNTATGERWVLKLLYTGSRAGGARDLLDRQRPSSSRSPGAVSGPQATCQTVR